MLREGGNIMDRINSRVLNNYYQDSLLNSTLYLCCQPGYFSQELDYREAYVRPDSDLYGTISMFYEVSTKESKAKCFVIPDGCIDVVIAFKEGICSGISICGTITNLYSIELDRCDFIFGMRFMPGKFPVKMIGNLEEYIDEQKDIQIYSLEMEYLCRMSMAKGFYERIRLSAEYFGRKCDSAGYKEKMVEYAMRRICSSNGNVSIKSLSNELVYSQRYIERVFKEYTGFTPKNMCRIVRAHKAAMYLLWNSGISKTGISMECGYSDLSHMNRELKSVMGVSSDLFSKENFYRKQIEIVDTVYRF